MPDAITHLASKLECLNCLGLPMLKGMALKKPQRGALVHQVQAWLKVSEKRSSLMPTLKWHKGHGLMVPRHSPY